MQSTLDDLIGQMRSRAREAGLTLRGMGRAAGIHENTLRGFWREDWSPNLRTLRALERALMNDDRGDERRDENGS